MATILRAPFYTSEDEKRIPPLRNGDKLTRAEFERRYRAMPDLKQAELIEGEVFMPSPVSTDLHAEPHADIVMWLGLYKAATKGIRTGDNGTVLLDQDNESQPDAFVFMRAEHGGQATVSSDGYVEGAPELVVEVAASSVSIDMNRKLNVYRRNGVREYIVWRVEDQIIDWFVLREGAYERLEVDSEGLYRSEVLPGLVLDPAAMIAGELQKVIETQNRAVQTESHADFVKRLAAAVL
jgi:Uma2 family endonuclease